LPITSVIIWIRHGIIGVDVVSIEKGVLIIWRVAVVIGVIGIGIGESSRPIPPPRPPRSTRAMMEATRESVSEAAAKSRMEATKTSMKAAA
jgi:hypothetical protein